MNWYEMQIRMSEVEREISKQSRIRATQSALPRGKGRLDHSLAWLGRGLVTFGVRLQQQGLADTGGRE